MSYESIITKCKKDWKCPELMECAIGREKIPFSSPLMNYSTYGGIPRNRITEFFGDEGCGKSTTAIDICKNAIDLFEEEYSKQIADLNEIIHTRSGSEKTDAKSTLQDLEEFGPKKVLYIDLEHSFDRAWSDTLGIDRNRIDIMQPPDISGENILNIVLQLIRSKEVGLIVLDSVPSLVPDLELGKELGERTVAQLAGLLTSFCRKVVPMLTECNTTLLVINQTRENMDNPYVIKTPGGKALKFYCSLRMNFRIGSPVDFLGNEIPKKSENPSGYIINSTIVKQKSAPNDRRAASYFLMFDRGIVPMYDFANLAIHKYGIIKKAAGWFSICNPTTGEILENEDGKLVKINGLPKVYQYLQDNPEYYESLKEYILNDIQDSGESISLEENLDDGLF